MDNLNLKILNFSSSKNKPKRFTSIAIGQKDRKCHFCSKRGIYVCPQCRQPYCSSECFRSTEHLECSEHFFKLMVFEYLKNLRADKEEKLRFLEILKRNVSSSQTTSNHFNNPVPTLDYMDIISFLNSPDDELQYFDFDWIKDERMCQFLKKVLANLEQKNELNDIESLWYSKLSQSEKLEFIEIVERNKEIFDQIILPWNPWWLREEWQTVVEEVIKDESQHSLIQPYPHLYNQIEPIAKMTHKTPSLSLPTSIMSTCFAYCYLSRYYNGEITCCNPNMNPQDRPPNCCYRWTLKILDDIVYLVPSLKPPSPFTNIEQLPIPTPFDALEMLITRWLTLNFDTKEVSHNFPNSNVQDPLAEIRKRKLALQQLLEDLRVVIEWQKPGRRMLIQIQKDPLTNIQRYAPKAIVLILSDLIHILDRIQKCLRHQKFLTTSSLSSKTKDLKLVKQKLKFYLSYTIEFASEKFATDLFLKALDFHLEKLRQEELSIQDDSVDNLERPQLQVSSQECKKLVEEIT